MWCKHCLEWVALLLMAMGCSQPVSDSTGESAEASTTEAAPKKPKPKRSRTAEPLVNNSPQECFDRMTEAADSRDVITLFECFAQEDRNRQVGMLAYHVERFIVFQTKESEKALALLTKYHLEKTDIMGLMQVYDSPGGQGAAKAVELVGSQIEDPKTFLEEATELINSRVDDKQGEADKSPSTAKLSDVKINGDHAEGTLTNNEFPEPQPIYFVKENGSWVITANAPETEERGGPGFDRKAAPTAENPDQVTNEQIIQKVRAIVADQRRAFADEKKLADQPYDMDIDVEKTDEGFSVFVIYGTGRNAEGELTGTYPGGHAIYKLDPSGNLVSTIPGA